MGALSITGIKPGSTSLKLTAGKITKTVPITVLSRNLLSYGPAEGNGLTATVNSDGSLHVTGTATRQWRGVSWKFPCPVQGTVKFSITGGISGLACNVKCLGANDDQLGEQINNANSVMAIPAGTVSLFLNVISAEATPTAKDGDLRIQLESGTTAHDWMRPDNTSLRGGGYELANLAPSFASLLPKTSNGVTFTSRDGHTVHVKGTATTWAQVDASVRLDAGTYMLTCDNSNGWNYGCRFLDGNNTSQLGGASVKLEAADYGVSLFVAEGKTVDIDLTPRIYRLD